MRFSSLGMCPFSINHTLSAVVGGMKRWLEGESFKELSSIQLLLFGFWTGFEQVVVLGFEEPGTVPTTVLIKDASINQDILILIAPHPIGGFSKT